MLSPRHARVLAVGLSFSSPAILAQQGWDLCPLPYAPDPKPILRPAGLDAMAVYLEANQALFRERGASDLLGDVVIAQGNQYVRADQAKYDTKTQSVVASGSVHFQNDRLQVDSERLEYNLNTGLGKIDQVAYLLNGTDGRGDSKRLVQESNQITRLEDATYTTCPAGMDSWSLKASEIKLDRETEKGTARHVSLQIHNKPLLYLPYFSFPLSDKRKSGFLIPNFGTDEKSGIRISAPYYFNLAPNYDLTVTGNVLSKRGVQLKNEFRYLTDKKQAGTILYDIIPNDNQYDGKLRYHYAINHLREISPNSQLSLQASGVSDRDYFNDLSTSLAASSIVNLERTLSYTSSQDEWDFSALAQSYQVLDTSAESYARLPQLQAIWQPDTGIKNLEVKAKGEYTYFSRSQGDNGHRIDTQAEIRQRFANEYAYITPAAKLHHTRYELERDTEKTVTRTVPTASLDAGLFFERELEGGKRLQTLEPRIYYTYTPFREQDNIPVFDSSERTLSYSQLFNDNRFTGKDRVADTNRLSTSLTTRLHHIEKGREIFRASIGQMVYFADRKVTLPDETLQTGTRSEVVAEMAGDLNDSTRLSGTAFIDTDRKQVSANQLRVNYRDQKERVLNLGYSQRKGEYEAAHISFATPVTAQWRLVGGYEQDLKNNRMLEALAGAEYQSCCWKGRVAARQYLLSDNTTYDDALLVEVELKGLGSFGSGTRNFLENRIYGYE